MAETRHYLDFEIVKEKWNKYTLSDGSKLKTRIILQSVWANEQNNQKSYQYEITQLTVMLCDAALQGEPSTTNYTPEEISKNKEIDRCRFDTNSYEMNEYLLDDSTRLQIHSNLNQISRTTLYKQNGDRLYLVNMQVNMTNIPLSE